MRYSLIVIPTLACLLASGASAQRRGYGRGGSTEKPPLAKSETEKRILDILERARTAGEVYMEVPPSDGRMLRLQAEAIGAKNVVEIGTSTGYSGLWICLALQKQADGSPPLSTTTSGRRSRRATSARPVWMAW